MVTACPTFEHGHHKLLNFLAMLGGVAGFRVNYILGHCNVICSNGFAYRIRECNPLMITNFFIDFFAFLKISYCNFGTFFGLL